MAQRPQASAKARIPATRAQHESAIQSVDIPSERAGEFISDRDCAAENTDRHGRGIGWTPDDYAPIAKPRRRGSDVSRRGTNPLKVFEQFNRPGLTQRPGGVPPAAEDIEGDGALCRRALSSEIFESPRCLALIHPPIKALAERPFLESWTWLSEAN